MRRLLVLVSALVALFAVGPMGTLGWDSPQTALHPALVRTLIARAAMADLALPA